MLEIKRAGVSIAECWMAGMLTEKRLFYFPTCNQCDVINPKRGGNQKHALQVLGTRESENQ